MYSLTLTVLVYFELYNDCRGGSGSFMGGGGGAQKAMNAKPERALEPAMNAKPERALEALVVFYALSGYLCPIFKHSDTK